MKRISLLLTLWLSLALSLTAQQAAPVPSFIRDSIDSYVAKALKAWDLPGVAVAVVKDGQVVLMEGYGYIESGKPERVDENTLFMIASNTKAFTGTSLALLEYEKKCSMDDKVQRWLPEFTMKDPWVAKEASLADLVSHRLGMETFQGDFMYWTSDLSRSEVIQKMGQLTPAFAFRNKWGYTNAAFVAAGVCIEKISGQSWDSFIESRFLKPLNMNRTLTLSAQIAQATNVAKPHTYNAQNQLVSIPWCQIDNIAPCASLSSSASDMTHWLIAQLERGVYEGKQVIPAEVIDRT
ncbi:MAG: class A beta-lactamase-related serine hydrolase, partial [Bacteroidetes bacterium]